MVTIIVNHTYRSQEASGDGREGRATERSVGISSTLDHGG